MKIKQAEELVGITSKNIRFYEDQGLLHPNRSENGYRNYTNEDVEILKRIKFLRKLGTPLEEIHQLFEGKISMTECLENREDALEKEQKNVEKMRILALQLLSQCRSIEMMDTDFWLDEMEKLEKEGTDFVDVGKTDIHRKKKIGAVAGACVMNLFMVALMIMDIWGYAASPGIPLGIFLLLLITTLMIIAGTFIAMVKRIKEIDKGEEDEAAKY